MQISQNTLIKQKTLRKQLSFLWEKTILFWLVFLNSRQWSAMYFHLLGRGHIFWHTFGTLAPFIRKACPKHNFFWFITVMFFYTSWPTCVTAPVKQVSKWNGFNETMNFRWSKNLHELHGGVAGTSTVKRKVSMSFDEIHKFDSTQRGEKSLNDARHGTGIGSFKGS